MWIKLLVYVWIIVSDYTYIHIHSMHVFKEADVHMHTVSHGRTFMIIPYKLKIILLNFILSQEHAYQHSERQLWVNL